MIFNKHGNNFRASLGDPNAPLQDNLVIALARSLAGGSVQTEGLNILTKQSHPMKCKRREIGTLLFIVRARMNSLSARCSMGIASPPALKLCAWLAMTMVIN